MTAQEFAPRPSCSCDDGGPAGPHHYEGCPLHVAAGESPTPAEVRRLADIVRPGECITFPNGVTVDKRIGPFPAPISPPWPGMTPTDTKPSCPACGLCIEGTLGYVCTRQPCPVGLGGPTC